MAGTKTIPLAPSSPEVGRRLAAASDKAFTEAAAARKPPVFRKGEDLVLAFQWSEADALQAIRVLEWASALQDLAPNRQPWNHVVTFRPRGTAGWLKERVDDLLRAIGLQLHVVEPAFDLPDERYPRGSVWGFWHIAQFCRAQKWDFMLMEPDLIPLHSAWVNDLKTEWMEAIWPYIGFIEPAHPSGGYPQHMAGCGMYNFEVWQHMPTDALNKAFDVALADHVMPLAQQSLRIFQKFGVGEPPRFLSRGDVARIIPPDASVFHRNKDGSLIRLLCERLNG